MKIDIGSGQIQLAEGHPLSLRGACGQRIECTTGMVWITVAGQFADIFLSAGQSHQVQGNGLTLVESIGTGSIRIGKPAGLPWFRRRLVNLPGMPRAWLDSALLIS